MRNASKSRLIVVFVLACTARLRAQEPVRPTSRGDSVVVRIVDLEIRTAVQALTPYLDHPAIVGGLPALRISLETPAAIPRTGVARLLREILEANGAEMTLDSSGTLYRIKTKEPPRQVMVDQSSMRPRDNTALELFVIRLQHAKANEVAATVNALYGRASALGEIGERPATLSQQLQQQQMQPLAGPPPPQAIQSVAGRPATLSSETSVVPDARANSLLIRATRADFELIQAAVSQIDMRPLQVLIEILIAEVRRDRGFDIGVGTTLPKTTIAKTENSTIGAVLEGAGTGLSGLAVKLMGVSGLDIEAAIGAAVARGDARLVNRPVLLAANNEKAEINVGSQRPFVQVSRLLPTENAAQDQIVQYRDVGTRLAIIPTISHTGYVMLDVVQEMNAATAEQQFNAPIISTRSVATRLLVKDGQTIVLGGLTDWQHEKVRGGIPFLSEIPLIGALFGRHSYRNDNTELLLFLTPRIVETDADAEALTSPLRNRARKIEP